MTLLPSSTVLATFTAEDIDGNALRIEIRPRMTPFGYVGKGFDTYCGDSSTDIGGNTVLGAIEAALRDADAMGWTGYAITEDGLNALAADASDTVDSYIDSLDSVADADVNELLEMEGAHPVWKHVGADTFAHFATALRAAFAARRA